MSRLQEILSGAKSEAQGVKINIEALTKVSYAQKGLEYHMQVAGDNPPMHDKLPGGNYLVKFNPFAGYYLEMTSSFPEMKKIYGETPKTAERILNTFSAKKGNIGVLLDGLKGSGKTLLARLISIKGAERGIPTLVINTPMVGEQFFQFLYMIQQECIILFDEYEKVYSDEDQQKMLTVLDGTFPSKKLFLLTSNDITKINSHLKNRPGRIHYHLNFKGLSSQFVKEYAEDNLKNKAHTQDLLSLCSLFSALNFDSLSTLIWEMNLYDEPAGKAIAMLNTKPESDARQQFNVEIMYKGVEFAFKKDLVHSAMINVNPMDFTYHPSMYVPIQNSVRKALIGNMDESLFDTVLLKKLNDRLEELKKDSECKSAYDISTKLEDEFSVSTAIRTIDLKSTICIPLSDIENDSNSEGHNFSAKDVKFVNVDTGTFVFENKNKNTILLSKVEERKVDYSNWMAQ
jgi:hypothetical protein